ncbi:large ribosomal subunit protein mL58 [Monosporozyma servazzii]
MIRNNIAQKIGIRMFHINNALCKKVTTEIKTGTMAELKGQPTIYNKYRSVSNVNGYRKAKVAPGMYIQKTQASPTGSIHSETIPLSFLSPDDPRRQQVIPHLQNNKSNVTLGPEVLTGRNAELKHVKSYNLTPKEVQQIIDLRMKDPNKYTRSVLAKQFGVSRLFISLVSSASPARLQEMQSRLDTIKSKWHKGRQEARADRVKRRQTWYRDL